MFVDNWYLILQGIEPPQSYTGTSSSPLFRNTFMDITTPTPKISSMYVKGWLNKNIVDVIFNNPATIVKWKDGTKTVVKCTNGDIYNKETGLALCIIKKLYGNDNSYKQLFKTWIKEDEENASEN